MCAAAVAIATIESQQSGQCYAGQSRTTVEAKKARNQSKKKVMGI